MNLFILDTDPVKAAQAHADRHVIKMVLETAQILSTNIKLFNIEYGYKITHKNHPCTIWARQSVSNFLWTCNLGIELSKEYTYRYGKFHKSHDIILHAFGYSHLFDDIGLTPFALAMPDEFKTDNPILSYRNYYINCKSHLLKYTIRNPPSWLNDKQLL